MNYYLLQLLPQMHPLNHNEECWHCARAEFDLLKILIIFMKQMQRGLQKDLILVFHQPLI